jgi:hypothetical protein
VAIPKDFQSGASLGRMKTSHDEAKMPNEYAEKFCKIHAISPWSLPGRRAKNTHVDKPDDGDNGTPPPVELDAQPDRELAHLVAAVLLRFLELDSE